MIQINGKGGGENQRTDREDQHQTYIGLCDPEPQLFHTALGGAAHDEADDAAVVAEYRTEITVLIAHGAGGIGEVAFALQRPAFVAAYKMIADPVFVHMVHPDGVFVGDGDDIQIVHCFYQIVQIVCQIRGGHTVGQTGLHSGAGGDGGDDGFQRIIDLVLQGAQGIAHGQTQRDAQKHKPAQHDPAHGLDKQGSGGTCFWFDDGSHRQASLGTVGIKTQYFQYSTIFAPDLQPGRVYWRQRNINFTFKNFQFRNTCCIV